MFAQDGNHYIAGRWVDTASNGYHHSRNPANGEFVGRSPKGSEDLAAAAIRAARDAFENSGWATNPRQRADILLRFAAVLEQRQPDIASLMSRENGKVISQALHEVAAGVSEARYYAGLARNLFGRTFESGTDSFRCSHGNHRVSCRSSFRGMRR